MTTAALILAGGNATRIGFGDDLLPEVGGSPLLSRSITARRPDTPATAISANGDPARFTAYGLAVLPDGAFAGQGPLAGVLAGLDRAAATGAELLPTVQGDTPLVPAGLAAPPPACASSNSRTHHLVAFWPTACRDALRALLAASGSRAIARFTGAIGMRRVAFPTGKWDPFLNVNTPDDLAIARSVMRRTEEGLP